jgi:hypothetical protein
MEEPPVAEYELFLLVSILICESNLFDNTVIAEVFQFLKALKIQELPWLFLVTPFHS